MKYSQKNTVEENNKTDNSIKIKDIKTKSKTNTDTDIQERIARLNKLEQEWKQSIKETKAAKVKYDEMYESMKNIKDGILKGNLSKKQIKAFVKFCKGLETDLSFSIDKTAL